MTRTTLRLFTALARATVSLASPRMLLLTLLPLVLTTLLWAGLAWWGWETAVNGLQAWIAQSSIGAWAIGQLADAGFGELSAGFHNFAAPILVAALALPLVGLTSIVMTALTATPLAVRHLERQRYATVTVQGRDSWLASLWNSLVASGLFALLWLLTLPLWLVPGLGFVLPLLLWGWLAYRTFGYDVLQRHAADDELHAFLRGHRVPLWILGIGSALLGAVPGAIWLGGAVVFVLKPLLALVALWLYAVVFVFASLAFAHYALAALDEARRQSSNLNQSQSCSV
ncbi:EI24 domain-containing protein [Derxia gummosa]|uniref:EI24 domain-containing protein n=1 Tax=Derxia gummosa DSM 723 TaxID=1121388 RepID=A0A8B6X9Y9_9BURK|nr:EI24 domain-containing protein [Derxia gummosa]